MSDDFMRLSVDVHNYLQNVDIQHEFFVMESPLKNAEQRAAVLGLNPKEVVTSVIITIDNEPVNAIIPSNRKISFTKLKKIFPNSNIQVASTKKIVETTGYVIGATPPVALKTQCKTIIDKSCSKLKVLYTGGGELNAMLKIRPKDLQKITDAQFLDISE